MKDIRWCTLSNIADTASLKQHAYTDNGKGGNISLCGRFSQYNENEKNDPINDIVPEAQKVTCCKICLKQLHEIKD